MSASFAELLRRYRIAASLTQEALADRCRLSPATIATLETGRRKAPRLPTVADISAAPDKFPGGTWWIELGPLSDPDGGD